MFVIVCEAAAQGLEAKSPPPRILPKPRGRFPSKSGSLYNLILKILKKMIYLLPPIHLHSAGKSLELKIL